MVALVPQLWRELQGNERYYLKAMIDYSGAFGTQTANITVSEQANVSYPSQVTNGKETPYGKYASLDGSTVLDGTFNPAPPSNLAYKYEMGWWGNQLSDEDGYFTSPYPTLTVEFSAREVHAIKVVGDLQRNETPRDFEIRLYDQYDNLLHTETTTDNHYIHFEKELDSPVSGVTKAELVITRWSHPNRQVKIIEFLTVLIQETYTDADIISLKLLEELITSGTSAMFGSIASGEMTLTLFNRDRRFDLENPDSPLAPLLKPNRKVIIGMSYDQDFEMKTYSYPVKTFTRNSNAYII